MTDRTMYDGINSDAKAISQIIKAGDLVAGYIDGDYEWSAADWALFPHNTHVEIAAHPTTNDGIIGDGPPDNGTWPQWVSWVVKRRAAGKDPWIYTNESSWPTAKQAFKDADVAEPHWWIAHYDNDRTIPAGALMKQFEETPKWDTSSCASYLPGIDPKPATTGSNEEDEDNVSKYEKTSDPDTGRCGIGFAEGECHTFQVTCDQGVIPKGGTWRLIIVLDTGPYEIANKVAAPHGKIVARVPQQFYGKASGVIAYGPKDADGKYCPYELYAQ